MKAQGDTDRKSKHGDARRLRLKTIFLKVIAYKLISMKVIGGQLYLE